MTYLQMTQIPGDRKSGFQPDSADGLPAGRLRIRQAGSLPAESGETPNFRKRLFREGNQSLAILGLVLTFSHEDTEVSLQRVEGSDTIRLQALSRSWTGWLAARGQCFSVETYSFLANKLTNTGVKVTNPKLPAQALYLMQVWLSFAGLRVRDGVGIDVLPSS